MAAGNFSFLEKVLTDVDLTITIKDTAGVVVDVTGWTFNMEVRLCDGSPVILSSASAIAITITDAVNGVINVAVPAASMNIDPKTYQYDLDGINTSSKVISLIQGDFQVEPRITSI